MSFNAPLINTYFEKNFTLDTGVARVYTWQSPPYPTTILSLEYAADAGCDGTDTMIWTLAVNTDTRITGTAAAANDTVTRNTAPDSGKSLTVPADAKCALTLTSGGTVGNLRGIAVAVKFVATANYPQGS